MAKKNPSSPALKLPDVKGFAGLIAFWSKSGDKDMRLNWVTDLVMLALAVILFTYVGLPMLGKLEIPGGNLLIAVAMVWLIYQVPYKAFRECWRLFTKKMAKRQYNLREL